MNIIYRAFVVVALAVLIFFCYGTAAIIVKHSRTRVMPIVVYCPVNHQPSQHKTKEFLYVTCVKVRGTTDAMRKTIIRPDHT